jgi:hypothetical protein
MIAELFRSQLSKGQGKRSVKFKIFVSLEQFATFGDFIPHFERYLVSVKINKTRKVTILDDLTPSSISQSQNVRIYRFSTARIFYALLGSDFHYHPVGNERSVVGNERIVKYGAIPHDGADIRFSYDVFSGILTVTARSLQLSHAQIEQGNIGDENILKEYQNLLTGKTFTDLDDGKKWYVVCVERNSEDFEDIRNNFVPMTLLVAWAMPATTSISRICECHEDRFV